MVRTMFQELLTHDPKMSACAAPVALTWLSATQNHSGNPATRSAEAPGMPSNSRPSSPAAVTPEQRRPNYSALAIEEHGRSLDGRDLHHAVDITHKLRRHPEVAAKAALEG